MISKEIDKICENCKNFPTCAQVGVRCQFWEPSEQAYVEKIDALYCAFCTQCHNRQFFEDELKRATSREV